MTFKISRADAVRSAMDSLILEGFTFTREEEKLLIEMTDIAKYINKMTKVIPSISINIQIALIDLNG